MEKNHCLPWGYPAMVAERRVAAMVRDDDYLRELLLSFEAARDWRFVTSMILDPSSEDFKRDYHIRLLADAGLMVQMNEYTFRMTSAGHDFIALTRSNEAWEATKNGVKHVAGVTIQMLFRVAEGYAVEKLRSFGVPI